MNAVPIIVHAEDGDVPAALLAGLSVDLPGATLTTDTGAFPGIPRVTFGTREWQAADADLLAFDRRIYDAEAAGQFAIAIHGERDALATCVPQILTRYQRLVPRTNAYSASRFFDDVVALHRAVHCLDKPLVRADYEHALDTWQWVLRLEPSATLAVQLAAIFHDIEKTHSELDRRSEELENVHSVFDQSGRGGSVLVRALLRRLDAWPNLIERVAALVSGVEHLGAEDDLELLNDANALSFFSRISPSYLAYFGAEHTERKVEYTLRRMRVQARERLGEIRMPAQVVQMIHAAYRRVIFAQSSAAAARRRRGRV
jgi:hypothetical protein